MSGSFRLLVLGAALTACATIQPATKSAETEVQHASDQVWAAHESANASSLADLVTEDAILMVPGFPDVVGRNAIRQAASQMFASTQISNFNVQRREIQVIGDSAYELAWYSETLRAKDGASSLVQGRYLIVWKRGTDNRWRVHRNLFNFASGPAHP